MCDRIESTTGECSLKIPNLWRVMLGAPMGQELTPEGRINEIEGRASEPFDTYAIYCNYDYSVWEYDAIVGCPAEGAVPEGMVEFTIPAGTYARFDVTPDTMIAAWDIIYGPDFPRGDVADFEAYRTDEDGNFAWPGFGDNMRVLQWIISRADDEIGAAETALGYEPNTHDIDMEGLEMSMYDMRRLLSVDRELWLQECEDAREYYEKIGKVPPELYEELDALEMRLNRGYKVKHE